MKIKNLILLFAVLIGFSACGEWLDVVPEGVATVDMAFNSRVQALKYLTTCYAYVPANGNISSDPAMLGGDELTTVIRTEVQRFSFNGYYISQDRQNVTEPLLDTWGHYYQALRDCNVFLENVGSVPDLPAWERDQWIAEVKVLKAYYHFLLVQMYGPVPLVRKNIPVSADITAVKIVREPVDNCFQYIVELIDEAIEGEALQMKVRDVVGELGRITKPIAMALKAKILVIAASPLFNGNSQMATLRNNDGTQLFNSAVYESAEWVNAWKKAVTACKEAITACHSAGIELYHFPNSGITKLTDTIATQMSIRNAFNERWNSDIIWANTQSIANGSWNGVQNLSLNVFNLNYLGNPNLVPLLFVPMKIAEMFYSQHGVPLAEDNTRDVGQLYELRTAKPKDNLYVQAGKITLDIHFDREPRFYAFLGFQGGIWFGEGRINDKEELYTLNMMGWTYGTGYQPKKYVPYSNMLTSATGSYSHTSFPWPVLRLSDLYLLYAEAINEAEGPAGVNSNEMFQYIDAVRARSGLKGVKESWNNYARVSSKYTTKTGMRDIIRQERMIELCLEGQRFWDIRRWKTAPDLYRTPIQGWNLRGDNNASFYVLQTMYKPNFGIRDYFWPIRNSEIINNPNLVQNIGW